LAVVVAKGQRVWLSGNAPIGFFLAELLDANSWRAASPPPWSVEEQSACFVVNLTRNAARRIAVGIAKLPELLRKA
jgi:hypothetical protein